MQNFGKWFTSKFFVNHFLKSLAQHVHPPPPDLVSLAHTPSPLKALLHETPLQNSLAQNPPPPFISRTTHTPPLGVSDLPIEGAIVVAVGLRWHGLANLSSHGLTNLRSDLRCFVNLFFYFVGYGLDLRLWLWVFGCDLLEGSLWFVWAVDCFGWWRMWWPLDCC